MGVKKRGIPPTFSGLDWRMSVSGYNPRGASNFSHLQPDMPTRAARGVVGVDEDFPLHVGA